jgi:hypothetical protein
VGLAPATYSEAATALGCPLGFVFVVLRPQPAFHRKYARADHSLGAFAYAEDSAAARVAVPIGNPVGALAFVAMVALTHAGDRANQRGLPL